MRVRCRPSPRLIVGAFLSIMVVTGTGAPGPVIAHQQPPVATPQATPEATPVATLEATPVATPEAESLPEGDYARSGALPGPGPEGDIGVQWTVTGEGSPGIPVAANDLVLLRNGSTLTAYDLTDGEMAWEFSRQGAISDPFVSAGVAYLADESSLIALDATTGELRWESNLAFGTVTTSAPNPVDAAPSIPVQPAVADGVAYVLSGTLVYAIDASNGDYIWRYDTQGQIAIMPPTVTASTVIFPASGDTDGQTTLALSRETGTPTVNLDRNRMYTGFASDDDLVVSWTGESLDISYDYSGVITSSHTCPQAGSPVLVDGQVLTVCVSDLYSLDPSTGEWQFLLPASGWNLLGVSDSELLVTREDDTGRSVMVVDVTSLESRWQTTLPPTIDGTLDPTGSMANGKVLVMTRTVPKSEGHAPGFTLVAIGGTDGTFGQPLPLIANPPAPGSFIRVANETNLLAAPSIEGSPISELTAGDQVLITGQIEEVDGTTWWQIDDPRSGRTGWVTPDVFEAGDE